MRPNNAAKALGFAYFGPVRILKMRTAEGVPRGTPIGDFFGSFLGRTRNERIILKTYYSQTEMSIYPIRILDRRTCEATSRRRSLQLMGLIRTRNERIIFKQK